MEAMFENHNIYIFDALILTTLDQTLILVLGIKYNVLSKKRITKGNLSIVPGMIILKYSRD